MRDCPKSGPPTHPKRSSHPVLRQDRVIRSSGPGSVPEARSASNLPDQVESSGARRGPSAPIVKSGFEPADSPGQFRASESFEAGPSSLIVRTGSVPEAKSAIQVIRIRSSHPASKAGRVIQPSEACRVIYSSEACPSHAAELYCCPYEQFLACLHATRTDSCSP